LILKPVEAFDRAKSVKTPAPGSQGGSTGRKTARAMITAATNWIYQLLIWNSC
jgi:hypothetical protein